MAAVINSINTVVKFMGEDSPEFQETVVSLRKTLTDLIIQENEAEKSIQVMLRLKSQVKEGELEGNLAFNMGIMEDMFAKAMKRETGPKLSIDKHPMMQKFESAIARSPLLEEAKNQKTPEDNDDDSDDDEEEPEDDNVRNTRCGHIYSQGWTRQAIKTGDLECPEDECGEEIVIADLHNYSPDSDSD